MKTTKYQSISRMNALKNKNPVFPVKTQPRLYGFLKFLKVTVFTLAVLISTQNFALAEGFEKTLTLDLSVKTALSINPDVLINEQKMEFARQRIYEARALYFPKIYLNLNFSKFNNTSPMVLPEDITGTPVYLPAGIKDIYYATRVSAWQNIYAGGRVKTTNKLAKINMDKTKNEADIVKIKVINNVKRAFNACLYYKEKTKFYEKASAKIKSVELERKLAASKFYYNKELLTLLSAIGLELNAIVDVSGEFKPRVRNFDISRCMLLAYQFKPEMQATQQQESSDALIVNLLSMQQYPTVYVGASQEWTGDQIIGDDSNWYVSLNVNIPVFDGGGTFARIKQGKINMREASLKRSKREDEIRLNINKALIEYNFWKEQAANISKNPSEYTETDLDIINSLNNSYYALELAVGVELDSY
ncbi:MAG: TolC family protein [Endomicrobium sp.]|jgi:outer membrane protein TolC|nr:TolC family protein [Endomicrobium sp.]